MSISSKVSNTQSKIRAIPDPDGEIKSQKSAAVDAADDVLADGREIASLARTAKWNDGEIIATARTAQQQLESALEDARRQLQTSCDAAREQLETALNRAQEDFQSTVTSITSNFANSVGTMESTKSENDGVHDDMSRIAS